MILTLHPSWSLDSGIVPNDVYYHRCQPCLCCHCCHVQTTCSDGCDKGRMAHTSNQLDSEHTKRFLTDVVILPTSRKKMFLHFHHRHWIQDKRLSWLLQCILPHLFLVVVLCLRNRHHRTTILQLLLGHDRNQN